MKKKDVFTVMVDEKEVELALKFPSPKQMSDSQKAFNKAFYEATENGAMLEIEVEELMRKRNLWNDEMENQANALRDFLRDAEFKLAAGGAAGLTKKTAKELALSMVKKRTELIELTSKMTSLKSNTAESLAETAKFNWLITNCLVYNDTGNKVFSSTDEYVEKLDCDYVIEASNRFMKMLYNLEDFNKSLPENKFLVQYGFADEKLRLVNDEGKLVSVDGKLIDEDGRYIDADGNYVDASGRRVNKDGTPYVEFQPFLED